MRMMQSLPPEFREGLIDLRPWGANEAALPLADARRSLDWFSQNQLAILGGDLWLDSGGNQYQPVMDNWSVDPKGDESWPCYVQRARALADRELARIEKEYGDNRIAIVPVVAGENDYEGLKFR
jgi:hypothetical protein